MGSILKQMGAGASGVWPVGGRAPWSAGVRKARAGSGGEGDGGRVVGRQSALGGVEAIDEELVQPQIGGDSEAVPGVQVDGVRVGTLLAAGVDTRSGVLNDAARRLEPPIGG